MAASTKVTSGFKSSEFLSAILVAAIVAGADVLGHPLNPETIAGVVATVIGYAYSRFGVKKAALSA